MGQVERGVVHGTNVQGPGGNLKNNGFLPLSGGAGTVHPSNMGIGGDAGTARSRWRRDRRKMSAPQSQARPPGHIPHDLGSANSRRDPAPSPSTRSCRAALIAPPAGR